MSILRKPYRKLCALFLCCSIILQAQSVYASTPSTTTAATQAHSQKTKHSALHASSEADIWSERRSLFDAVSLLTGIPWYDLAAIDQYERTMLRFRAKPRRSKEKDRVIAVPYTEREWAGWMNPNPRDTHPLSIALFHGKGLDGNGDGQADRTDNTDVLYTEAMHIQKYGIDSDDFRIAVWKLYHNPRSVTRISEFAKVYETFDALQLDKHVFPVPIRSSYSYRNTWGARRGWGGRRIHEGTDIFAGYGVPVRSTCYGIIEIMGWNKYGGWRVGIRSIGNVYHYYAHLSGFNKKFKEGNVVRPGDVVGWVGSSGYGKKGTQGKFPPHLHYGMYRDNGLTEWSFDPYPYLRKWEREEYRSKRKH